MIAPRCYIVDGPPVSAGARRDAVKANMVRDLVAWAAGLDDHGEPSALDHRDTVRRMLYARDYAGLDVELLADDAIAEARRKLGLGGAIAHIPCPACGLLSGHRHPCTSNDASLDRTLDAVSEAMAEPHPQSSSPGLTRRSIPLDAQRMDARVKPGHDDRGSGVSAGPHPDPFTAAKIAVMAQDLVRYGAFGSESAAIRTLSGRGHGQGDIIRLVDRAMARARELYAAAPKERHG
ncbi:hypothetical protein ACQR1Y_11955 [Bradyrhizobium sp. HKCCYLRH3099]|uniref:hypothetical protein n=1 Tax=unclassified Bradyrhizobium TaxID=2631580 RepID=UPI003EB78053